MSEQKPTVGRIVHYRAHGSPNGEHKAEMRAAIITAVYEGGDCHLAVLNPSGMFFNRCPFDAAGENPGSWSWPARA